jgi:heme/copper-type cytochrome/quinol oxidase subunit 3
MSQGTAVKPDLDLIVEVAPELAERPAGPPPSFPEPPSGPDDEGRNDPPEPPISNARLGIMLFIGAEAMFFAGLLSAFLVFRTGSEIWPPPLQPRLPIVVTALNTVVLLCSGVTMRHAVRSIRRGNRRGLIDWLMVTALLGMLFLAVQGYEWTRLLQFGLTLSAGVYGATFYTLIGCHAAHVFGALIWLFVLLTLARRQRFSPQRYVGAAVCGMYWYFVVALWPLLFVTVYLY